MNEITINGKKYSANGGLLSVNNNKIYVDGKLISTEDEKYIDIRVVGSVDKIDVDNCNSFYVEGDTGSIKTMSGDVDVKGGVTGNVGTMSGDVTAGAIGGDVSSMSGDISKGF